MPRHMEARVEAAVHEAVRRQIAAGVSIVNDGEMSKPSYATYVKDRLTGFNGEAVQSYHFADLADFPRSADLVAANPGRRKRSAPACTGPISVGDPDAARRDMEHLVAAAAATDVTGMFSSAASPGVVSLFFANEYYDTREEYVFAIAEAMRHEYEAIAAVGATVQLDCPDLAMGRHSIYAESRRRRVPPHHRGQHRRHQPRRAQHPRRAVADAPVLGQLPRPAPSRRPDRRHHRSRVDRQTADRAVRGGQPVPRPRVAAVKELGVPDDKVICPGVIEPQSNYIEHPELVAQRLERWATVVDPSRLMAGVDCGFSVHVGMQGIDPDVAWAKLAAMAAGCEIASRRLRLFGSADPDGGPIASPRRNARQPDDHR